MGLSHDGYVALVYSLAAVTLTAFFAYALWCSYMLRQKNQSVEQFITARGQVCFLAEVGSRAN